VPHPLGSKLVPLEAYRGIASCIVVIHHFFLAFSPFTLGAMPNVRDAGSLVGQPYFALVNGTGAVGFFFTLSGFVLSWSYFHSENPQKLQLAFFKRWPRLVCLVTVSTLASYLLFKLDAYHFHEAGKLSKSPWLSDFANAHWTPDFEPNFLEALVQGVTTFFTGQTYYNTNLWTMKHEFFGSLVVYMLASFITTVLGTRHLPVSGAILAIAAIFVDENIFPFVVGVFLSLYVAKNKPEMSDPASAALIVAGLYLLGYMVPEQAYGWVPALPKFMADVSQIAFHTVGSACIIFATMANVRIFASLSGGVCRWLGKLSFPLYLMHVVVICSLSSFLYLLLSGWGVWSWLTLTLVFLVTAAASVAVSIPLARLDDWWVGQVNAQAGRVLDKAPS
jgi:peptidoglycan/LPS O-acetylase OafA/YrhL